MKRMKTLRQYTKSTHACTRARTAVLLVMSAILSLSTICCDDYSSSLPFATSRPSDSIPLVMATDPTVNFPRMTPEQLATADGPFEFRWYRGGRFGHDVIDINADGQCRLVMNLQEIKFQASPEQMAALRQTLIGNNFAAIRQYFYLPGVADGTQLYIDFRVGNHAHHIYCDNKFPTPVINLHDFLSTTFVAPSMDQLKNHSRRVGPNETWPVDDWFTPADTSDTNTTTAPSPNTKTSSDARPNEKP